MKPQPLVALMHALNDDATNYFVSLGWYRAPRNGATSEDVIRKAIGDDVVAQDFFDVSSAQVFAELSVALCHAGDPSSDPKPSALLSEEFRQALAALFLQVEAAAAMAGKIEAFRFESGHPFYPVFWDFAFLFTVGEEGLVLVGSSSD